MPGTISRFRPDLANGPVCDPSLRLSERLAWLAEAHRGRLSLQELVAALGEKSFGSALLVMAIPATVMPPMASALFGGPLLVVSLQLLIGVAAPRLPGPLGRLSLSAARASTILRRAAHRISRLERLSHPRLQGLLHPAHVRVAGLACLAMSLVMCLPTPMAHSAAGLSIGAFATGLLQRDGLALVAGWVLAIVCGLLMTLLVAAGLKLH
jgi:hypothetical protein